MARRRSALESMDLSSLFGGVYSGRRVLVTGHTGFKGSWLSFWLTRMGAEVAGLSLDPDTEPSHWTLLALPQLRDQRVDLRDADAVGTVISAFRPETIFHLGAQALVRRSYREPADTFGVNVMGLVNVFEAVRRCPSVRVLVNATTDKVYAEGAASAGFRESDPLGGHDPYSTSKACAELVSDSYRKCFFHCDDGRGFRTRLATARAGNVIGGGDWAEDRLVPDLVRAGLSGEPLQIRNPGATRPWQHVLEPISGYLRLGQLLWDDESLSGAWNFGPGSSGEISVQELASRFLRHWPGLSIQGDERHHPYEAAALRLDSTKAMSTLAWRPVWDVGTAIARTAEWYRSFSETGCLRTAEDVGDYVSAAKEVGLAWAT